MGGLFKGIAKVFTGGGDDGAAAATKAAADAQDQANAIAAKTASDAAAAQQQLADINKNYATDLSAENRVKVEAGGTAAAVDATTDNLKKKQQGSGLASTLGINV